MDKIIKPTRFAAIIILLVVLSTVTLLSLYNQQIVVGAEYAARSQNSVSSNVDFPAARGNIFDRYGREMTYNRSCNNLTINTDVLFDQEDPNAVILELVNAVADAGDSHIDELPITKEPPFEYTKNIADIQQTWLNDYFEAKKLPASTTAVELMAFFRTEYDIDANYTAEETRTIAGVRFELNVRYITPTYDYTFAEDVSMDLITTLMEKDMPGFQVVTSYVREYASTSAAHILGYTGMMSSDQYNNIYQSQGYPLNALVGQAGIELAFEKYLHGKDGKAEIISTKAGTIISTNYTEEVNPGGNVYVTTDLGLQEAAEAAMAAGIESINAEREANNAKYEGIPGYEDEIMEYVPAGAVVAIQVKTGEPLCIASYPTFDVSTVLENYNAVLEAENQPLFNRALSGTYAPGSTFKPVTAMCALDLGLIDLNTTFTCVGIYDKYKDAGYAPTCWVYPYSTHGSLNVTGAVEHSCNYFFYSIGDLLDGSSDYSIDTLAEYANRFGLGGKTGIELDEETGAMATKEYNASLWPEGDINGQWFVGNSMAAAIGQSVSNFTPMQLAVYTATLANNGTRYSASILKSVRSYDNSETIYTRTPEILAEGNYDQAFYDAVQLGMNRVVTSGSSTTVSGVFNGVGYTLAAKTGTAQTGSSTNNATFICYAPYEDPEIAVAVVLEKGGSGSALAGIAKDVLDYYFNFKNSTAEMESENTLLK